MLVWIFLEPKHPYRDKHGEERHADILPRLKRWQRPEGDKEMPLLLTLMLIIEHPQVMLNNRAKQELDHDVQHHDVQKEAGQTRHQVEHPCEHRERVVGGGAVPNVLETPKVSRTDGVHKCCQR